MALIPDIVLQKAIARGMKRIRSEDSKVLDAIFKDLTQAELAAIKTFIAENKVNLALHHPRQDLAVPAFTITLKSESEAEAFLGDMVGDSSNPFVPDQDLTIDTLSGHGASISGLSGLPKKVLGPLNVVSQTGSSTISFDEDATALVQELTTNPVGCLRLYVVAGSGAGQVYDVLRLRNDSLDIDGTFTLNLDSTSVIDLRVPFDPELSDGQPSRVFLDSSGSLVKRGVNYEVNYQIHVLAAQREQVVYLYSILKAILLMQRRYLESQGLKHLQIGGTDLSPNQQFLPDEIFQRSMNVKLVYMFGFIEEQPVFDKLRVDILPEPADNLDSEVIGVTIQL